MSAFYCNALCNSPAGFARRLDALYHPDWGYNIRGKKFLFPGVRPILTAVVAMHGASPQGMYRPEVPMPEGSKTYPDCLPTSASASRNAAGRRIASS